MCCPPTEQIQKQNPEILAPTQQNPTPIQRNPTPIQRNPTPTQQNSTLIDNISTYTKPIEKIIISGCKVSLG